MSVVGIVGSEEAKFSVEGRREAIVFLKRLISEKDIIKVVSGRCHLGGIDIWAIEIAKELGKEIEEFPPAALNWEGGYKQRNIKIAEASDFVYCITVDCLPESYKGMRFESCYHCHTNTHVKSGGCWTAKYAKKLGKPAYWWVVKNGESA